MSQTVKEIIVSLPAAILIGFVVFMLLTKRGSVK